MELFQLELSLLIELSSILYMLNVCVALVPSSRRDMARLPSSKSLGIYEEGKGTTIRLMPQKFLDTLLEPQALTSLLRHLSYQRTNHNNLA